MTPNMLSIVVYVASLAGVVVYSIAVYRATRSGGATILATVAIALVVIFVSGIISFGVMALLAGSRVVDPGSYQAFKSIGAVVQSAVQLMLFYIAYKTKFMWPASVSSAEQTSSSNSSKLVALKKRTRAFVYVAIGITAGLIALSAIGAVVPTGTALVGLMRLMLYLLIGIVLLVVAQLVEYAILSRFKK